VRGTCRHERTLSRGTAVTIFHNPSCGTSRNVLALLRHAGLAPTVVEYLKTPPSRGTLSALLAAMGVSAGT
jgi:arsenate reductase